MDDWKRLLKEGASDNFSEGNKLTLLVDGDESFRSVWEDIDRAERRVWMETYVFAPDDVGQRTMRKLVEAARRGCDVVLIYDSQGSPDMTEDFARPLREAGGRVVPFSAVYPWQRGFRRLTNPLHRDHRKVLVVDDGVAYSGGRNISEEYAGEKWGTNRFEDTLLRIEGPATRALARLFTQSLQEASELRRSFSTGTESAPAASEGVPVRMASLDRKQRRDGLNRLLERAIEQSRNYCYITAAYFVPPQRLIKALAGAARRGVDVRILTAGSTDLKAARMAKRYTYGPLLKSGVRIHEMYTPMLHAKHLVIDDRFSMVGSYNLDRWSDEHNLEVSVAALDTALAGQIRDTHLDWQARSEAYTLPAWSSRPLHWHFLQRLLYTLMQL